MFDSDGLRFVTAVIFLAGYSVLEHHFQLGILVSVALSVILYWRCNSVLSMMSLVADLFFYCYSYKDYGCIPFLISETVLVCARSRSEVRISMNQQLICFLDHYPGVQQSTAYKLLFSHTKTTDVTACSFVLS